VAVVIAKNLLKLSFGLITNYKLLLLPHSMRSRTRMTPWTRWRPRPSPKTA
jgi:hypothetical protein